MTRRRLWYLLAALAALTAFWGLAFYSTTLMHMIVWFFIWAAVAALLLWAGMHTPADSSIVPYKRHHSSHASYRNDHDTMPSDYTAIDLLTTGSNPTSDHIFEFAAVRVRDGMMVSKMSMLVNPGEPLSEDMVNRTGVTDATLARQPEVVVGLKEFLDFVGTDTLVAPNVDLDRTFLEIGAQRHGLPLPQHATIDPLALDHQIFPQDTKFSMDDMIRRCDTEEVPVDRAMANAEQAVSCYEWLDAYVNRSEISMEAARRVYDKSASATTGITAA